MKKRNIYLAALAAAAVLTSTVGSAWAYFTTYVEAQGTHTIKLEDETTIEEPEVVNWVKHIVVKSDDDSKPVYVRARGFSGSKYPLTYSGSEKWTPGEDDYYYYSDILNAGEETEELLVQINNVPKEDEIKDVMELDVAVVYETTPVLYDDEGKPYADWNGELDVTVQEGGNK